MGQKIHPTGFRLAISRNWSSRWYANDRDFAGMLAEDIKVREYLKRKLAHASVGRVLIERPAKNARVTVYSARPGVVIGKKGADIEKLRKSVAKLTDSDVVINIVEIRKPELDAQLVAESISQQLERRVAFRRAMKRAVQSAMRLGAEKIATGHYARVRQNAATGLFELLKGLDPSKDQSYFLHRLNQAQLWTQYNERLQAAGMQRDDPMVTAAGGACGHSH